MKKGDLILFHDPVHAQPPEPGIVLCTPYCDQEGHEEDRNDGLAFVNFENGEYWVDIDDCELLNGDW